jgi:hypothetical protein
LVGKRISSSGDKKEDARGWGRRIVHAAKAAAGGPSLVSAAGSRTFAPIVSRVAVPIVIGSVLVGAAVKARQSFLKDRALSAASVLVGDWKKRIGQLEGRRTALRKRAEELAKAGGGR